MGDSYGDWLRLWPRLLLRCPAGSVTGSWNNFSIVLAALTDLPSAQVLTRDDRHEWRVASRARHHSVHVVGIHSTASRHTGSAMSLPVPGSALGPSGKVPA